MGCYQDRVLVFIVNLSNVVTTAGLVAPGHASDVATHLEKSIVRSLAVEKPQAVNSARMI